MMNSTQANPTQTPGNWPPERIKRELPVTFDVIANRAGVTPAMVSKVVNRSAKSRKVSVEIARALRKPLEEVFPDVHKPKRGLRDLRVAQEGAHA